MGSAHQAAVREILAAKKALSDTLGYHPSLEHLERALGALESLHGATPAQRALDAGVRDSLVREQVLAALRAGPRTKSELLSECGYTRAGLRAIRALTAEGTIERAHEGEYRLAGWRCAQDGGAS